MHASVAVASCVVVLGMAIAAISVPLHQANSSADDLWAEALLLSFPAEGVTSAEVAATYERAVTASRHQAPLLVAFGDFYRGPLVVGEQFNAIFDPGPQEPDFPGAAEDLMQTIDGDAASVLSYRRAVEVQRDYLPAWYRLACFAEGDKAVEATRELQKRVPGNALGWYLEAAQCVQDERLDDAFPLVERGNACSLLRTYPIPLPVSASLVFPEIYDEYAGRKVTQGALKLIYKRQSEWFAWADPFVQGLVAVEYAILNHAESSANAGNVEYTRRHAVAAHRLAEHMIRVEPPDGIVVMRGIAFSIAAWELIQSNSGGDDRAFLDRKPVQDRIERLRQLVRDRYGPLIHKLSDTDPAAVFSGNASPVDEEIECLSAIRKEAGFTSNLN